MQSVHKNVGVFVVIDQYGIKVVRLQVASMDCAWLVFYLLSILFLVRYMYLQKHN